jgi:hypothetical protein
VDRHFDSGAWKKTIRQRAERRSDDRHWTLENYVGVLLGARFELREFLEPVATEEEVRQSDQF